MRTCALQNVCSTIVTEMKKKLCWHNGNLLFMTRFFSERTFFFFCHHYGCCCSFWYSFWLWWCHHGKDKCFESIFYIGSSLLLYDFFYWSSDCKDSNECHYLTASWMKSNDGTHSKWVVSVFLFSLWGFYFTCFSLFIATIRKTTKNKTWYNFLFRYFSHNLCCTFANWRQ